MHFNIVTVDNSLVWFRRDLRSYDHAALYAGLKFSRNTHCVFIFDETILGKLPKNDRRVSFIHQSITELANELEKLGGGLLVRYGDPIKLIPELVTELKINAVFANHDYEPYAQERDAEVQRSLQIQQCDFFTFKDQVIFEKDEILSLSRKPFSIFTPYKNAWLKQINHDGNDFYSRAYPVDTYAHRLAKPFPHTIPSLESMGFIDDTSVELSAMPLRGGMQAGMHLINDFLPRIHQYELARNFPAIKGPSYLSMHLRFGTISIRHLVREALRLSRIGDTQQGAQVWLSELIWRDFYFMILFHHPHVASSCFKPKYNAITWESNTSSEVLFDAWCKGETGYPLVDAAMCQLNQTGYMHNRLRMVTASFLVKDLGISWQRGEQYFALHLNDFDLAANNGGWQWAASTGCDAQPYFRIFNPIIQSEKFDPDGKFIRRYLPQLERLNNKQIHAPWKLSALEFEEAGIILGQHYPTPIVDHAEARAKTLARYAVITK